MKLIFLGTGSAFCLSKENFQSNLLIDDEKGRRLLIDCGTDIRNSLHSQQYTPADISDVYISHLHADHAGGLGWLAQVKQPRGKKVNLYVHERLATSLWESSLSGELPQKQGQKAKLIDFYNVHAISDNGFFTWSNAKFTLIQMVHAVAGFSLMLSFGLILNYDHRTIFITTDTQFCPNQIKEFYHKADLIFQDCETASSKSGVHAHFEELSTLPKEIKAKMWLYHYNPGALPDPNKVGFAGFVQRGQVFLL